MDNLDFEYLNELVIKARQGSSNAFAELYTATYQRQYAYSYRYVRDEHLAQDALQESFIRVLKNIGKLEKPELFIAWLNQINFHVCYDMKKQRGFSAGEVDIEEMHDLASTAPTPEEEAVEVDYNRYILRQVESLPMTESQVILMKYYQNMSLDEIAEQLNISRSTVKRYLKSGKEHLEKLVSREGGGRH